MVGFVSVGSSPAHCGSIACHWVVGRAPSISRTLAIFRHVMSIQVLKCGSPRSGDGTPALIDAEPKAHAAAMSGAPASLNTVCSLFIFPLFLIGVLNWIPLIT